MGKKPFRTNSDIIPKECNPILEPFTNPKKSTIMAKITPIDIIKGVSGKFGGNSKEYFATNKTSYNIYFAKRVNDFQGP